MITFASFDDVPVLKKIWVDCFGDSADYIDYYFKNGFMPQNTLVYREDGVACAMVTLFPAVLQAKNEVYPVHYIYAAATSPQYQGRGIMRRLLSFAENYGKEQGIQAFVLVPGSKTLFEYYNRLGYTTKFNYSQVNLTCHEFSQYSPLAIKEVISFTNFKKMREDYLSEHSLSLHWGDNELHYVVDEIHKTKGNILNFSQNGLQGYAVCYRMMKDVLIKEIGTSIPMLMPFLSAIEKYYHAERYTVRLNEKQGLSFLNRQIVPFGMIKPLFKNASVDLLDFSGAFMGLMLD